MILSTASPKRFRNNKQKKVRLIASVGMPSLVLASLAFTALLDSKEFEEM
jgi:hypothetical protein